MECVAGGPAFRYEVRLPLFEGPLDLLLHLIERQELDITAISLAQVTDQYLSYISQLEERNAMNLADFLVVASKLLLIKSRLLLPSPPVPREEEDEEDVGADLVRQLIEYKKFKDVAAMLAGLEERGWRSYVRLGPVAVSGRTLDLGDVSLEALTQVVRRALAVSRSGPPVSTVIPPIFISLTDQMERIRSVLTERRDLDFAELVATAASRLEVIVTFLAVLELIKQGYASVEQEGLFGRIIILRSQPQRSEAIEQSIEQEEAAEP